MNFFVAAAVCGAQDNHLWDHVKFENIPKVKRKPKNDASLTPKQIELWKEWYKANKLNWPEEDNG